MRYRKKPVVIEAYRIGDFENPMPLGWLTCQHYGNRDDYIEIETLEGRMRGNRGDWIIKGIKGEFYPCKPDIFEATYEPI